MYFLETKRVGFRTWRAADTELAVALWTDPDVTRLIAGSPPSRASAEARLAIELALQAEHRVQYWPIFRLADAAHLGCCGLRPHRETLELGVHILPEFWRQGFALEAARAVIDHAFQRLRASALFAGHHPSNVASRAMLLALGFVYTHDELYPPTGLLHPSYAIERG